MAKGIEGETLVAFESGHYKKINGEWISDSVWSHFQKDSGGIVHVNKDLVEYIETFSEHKPYKARRTECRCEKGKTEVPSKVADESQEIKKTEE